MSRCIIFLSHNLWFKIVEIKNKARTFVGPLQSQEISSLELVTNQGKDVIGGIQPKFVYQSASPNYYEPMEH